jgi:acyl-CoA thioester hydrolase
MINKTPQSQYKIRFNDCDMFGHLNNARYLDYFINAREDHVKEHYGLDLNDYYSKDMVWLIGSHEIVYVKPALYNEIVTIQSTLLRVEHDYLHVETIMTDAKQSHLKAVMRTRLIPVNPKTGKKQPHLDEFLNWAKSIENDTIEHPDDFQARVKGLIADFKIKSSS